MTIKILMAVATLAFGLAAAGKITTAHSTFTSAARAQARAALNQGQGRLQALIDVHMSSEAAMAAAERAAVVAVRGDLSRDDQQQQSAIAKIRKDYRGRTETLTALHLSQKEALGAELPQARRRL